MNPYLSTGVPYVGPNNVFLHIFVVELYILNLNYEYTIKCIKYFAIMK